MTDIELDVTSNRPCVNPMVQGAYFCNLHWWNKGLRHRFFQVGNTDPSGFLIGEVTAVMLQAAEERRNVYKTAEAVPVRQLVAMSIIRACMHPIENNGTTVTPQRTLTAERVASVAFVKNPDRFYSADYGIHQQKPRISAYGVANMRVSQPDNLKFVAAQHLPVTQQEQKDYPVRYAIESLAARGEHNDVWIALRPQPEEERFIERLVSREELLDTFLPGA